MDEQQSDYGYGKRPMWQWILLCVVIAGILYALMYYFASQTQTTSTQTVPLPPQPVVVQTPAASAPAASVTVSIKNFAFSPATLSIKTGTKVTWTNNDSMAHTVTSDSGNLLNSSTLAPGKSFSFTFTSPGSVAYHCAIHSTMKGTVNVVSTP